jgi:glycosyltransferase involved in cell wall biosynthesis
MFCPSKLDFTEEGDFERVMRESGFSHQNEDALCGNHRARIIYSKPGGVPLTTIRTASTQHHCYDPEEAAAILAFYQRFLDTYRPEVLLTYGGDPITDQMINLAKRRDATVVFMLHNLHYDYASFFRNVDYCLVPSDFARRHYWEKLGLACHVLPNVISPYRVLARERDPKYVTFVNPMPHKGLAIFWEIAKELARRRPDIPLLVVEGVGAAASLFPTDEGVRVRVMLNTPRAHEFYAVTKILLVPSMCDESFGLVAAEAMINGIPVLAGNRGALPEIVGDGGFLFHVPSIYITDPASVESESEIEPWVDTIVNLWDDPQTFKACSLRALRSAERWGRDRARSQYEDFFRDIHPQPGPPLVPRVSSG